MLEMITESLCRTLKVFLKGFFFLAFLLTISKKCVCESVRYISQIIYHFYVFMFDVNIFSLSAFTVLHFIIFLLQYLRQVPLLQIPKRGALNSEVHLS